MKNMTAMNAKRKQTGFTIIELVVVILLLGILTATALPRFMDVTDEAHDAVVDAVVGGFATGTALFRAQWVAEGQPLGTGANNTTGLVSEYNLFASATGYPLSSTIDSTEFSTTTGTLLCADTYEKVLQSGRPEVNKVSNVVTGLTVTTANNAVAREAAIEAQLETANTTGDILPVLVLDSTTPANTNTCIYYYVGQYQEGNATVERDIPIITYNFVTGDVTRGVHTFETTE